MMFNDHPFISKLLFFVKHFFIWLVEADKENGSLKCLVGLRNSEQDSTRQVFIFKICGILRAAKDRQRTILQIVVTDLTDGIAKANPAYSTNPRYRLKGSDIFCFKTELGKLPRAVTILSRWTAIASINADWLLLPKKGRRNLLFVVSIFSLEDGLEIASAYSSIVYDNTCDGYIDILEKDYQLKVLSSKLALAVAAAGDELTDSEIGLVRQWVSLPLRFVVQQDREDGRLQAAISRTARLIGSGRQVDVSFLCEQIAENSSLIERYNILEFCMNLARSKGSVNEQKLLILNEIGEKLGIEKEHFLNMAEKILPAEICRVSNVKIIIGITPGMEVSQVKKLLNSQYRKWSARVTNYDSDVRQQAAFMLNYIAQARSEYETDSHVALKSE